jgi:hypothetical protein
MDIPLGHDLLEIAQAQRKSKIPTNAQDDDLGFKMSPLKRGWPVPSHERPSLSDSCRRFATLPTKQFNKDRLISLCFGMAICTRAPGDLIEGGFTGTPNLAFYTVDSKWESENHGVAPDVEVELDPAQWRQGHDTQLEKAVEESPLSY